jgi:hypothetical protein
MHDMGLLRASRSFAAVAAVALAGGLAACGGGDDEPAGAGPPARTSTAPATTGPPRTAPPPPRPLPLPGLPRHTAGFESWERLNARPIPPDSAQTRRVGFDAHRSFKDVHVNPAGTVIVKAGRAAPGGDVVLVAVMRRVLGSDPEHGDWEFVEYKRSGGGEPFTTGPGLTGEVCWSCHAVARETDWVFTPRER